MINVSAMTSALAALLKADPALMAYAIERSQRVNWDPARCPWVGVYPGTVATQALALGAGGSRWRGLVTLQVVAQTASFEDDGAAASDELEALVESIESVVTANLTLGLTGVRVVGLDREYRYDELDDDQSGSIFAPQCLVKIAVEARTA